ncbi:F0F1 ATP synthase subunit gamma [Candidatus Roizmanbacteria bacterium]|nr:F0F1 ATP synthase subunit gamma [Candidatus Roizmanbacteria bacterium]
MTSKKEVNYEIDYLGALRAILETYEEIAASRMGRIRTSVLKSRDFLFEINAIFQEVKSSYKDEVGLLMKRKKIHNPKELTFLNRNGKTLFVLISANTGFYGEIVRRTYNLFLENLKKEKVLDVMIIGRLGYEFFEAEKINVPHSFFDLPDDRIDKDQLKIIVEKIIQYQKVLVFYEQFNNVINQTPIITNISGDPLSYEKEGPRVKYFFEPTLEKIMAFFEKEIVASIFEQTILESELAKFAARMVALDASTDNTKKKLKQVLFQKERLKHRQGNKEQIEKFASMLLWR